MGVIDQLNRLDDRLGLSFAFGVERHLDAWPGARESWEIRTDRQKSAVRRAVARGRMPADQQDLTLWLALADAQERSALVAAFVVLLVPFVVLVASLVIALTGGPLGHDLPDTFVWPAIGVAFGTLVQLRRSRKLGNELMRMLLDRQR